MSIVKQSSHDSIGETSQKSDLEGFKISRLDDIVAITTPIPDARGNTSSKTPLFHLPVYKVDLTSNGHEISFHCDLADLTDLVAKLKELNIQWRRSGC